MVAPFEIESCFRGILPAVGKRNQPLHRIRPLQFAHQGTGQQLRGLRKTDAEAADRRQLAFTALVRGPTCWALEWKSCAGGLGRILPSWHITAEIGFVGLVVPAGHERCIEFPSFAERLYRGRERVIGGGRPSTDSFLAADALAPNRPEALHCRHEDRVIFRRALLHDGRLRSLRQRIGVRIVREDLGPAG
ncbi:hypothetical protein D3C87_1633280 [compost metagenome]